MSVGELQIQNLKASYATQTVFQNISFHLEAGERLAIMGPSGCGKSTLLRILAGLKRPCSGHVEGLEQLKVRLVFQEPRLLPWKNVQDNILLAEDIKDDEVNSLFQKLVHLSELEHVVELYPSMLSGGMAQRVALLRALITRPDILLLDEAFSSLDRLLRRRIIQSFLTIYKAYPQTTILVTHQPEEAFEFADRVIILNGTPATICGEHIINDSLSFDVFRVWLDEILTLANH